MNNFKVLSFALLGLLGLLGVIGEGLTIATDNFSSGVSCKYIINYNLLLFFLYYNLISLSSSVLGGGSLYP